MSSTATLADVAGRRGRTYWLLARGFAEAPGSVLLGELITALGPVNPAEPLAAETAAFADALHSALSADAASDALAIEFTRLFGGISESYGGPPPFESVVRSGNWGGDIALAVVAAYADAEIVPPLPDASPPDHLAAELRFLAIACHREGQAWQADDTQAAMDWVGRERDFLDQHVLRWVPEYCRQAAGMAETPFYRALLALTPRACELDREDIDAIFESVPSFAENV
ncbi:MAG: molecular chaperone TorD family protein [Sulfuritalea sp.]|nr:molecular chaperone TorD family protein [Sulfuritalea sp.]